MHTRIPRDGPQAKRAFAGVVLLAVAACSGLNDPIAGFDNAFYNSAVYALNGSPIGAPTAINTANALTVRADVGYEFDIAFDLDASGRPVVLTQRAVGLPASGTGHTVALQPMTGDFDLILDAPDGGWVTDSILTVSIGQAFAVRATVTLCQLYGSPYLYSKAVVDSIRTSTRQIWLSVVTDPNCGFRSFVEGRPTH